jgi:hypothetical protein
MINKNIDDITELDLQALITNSVVEGKTIEYKQELVLVTDGDKKEFLADISSFANASGGDIIYGISENKSVGIPESVKGIEIKNTDEETRKIESLIRDGVAPRISSINIKFIKLSNLKYCLIIRIPKSWNSPHQIIFKGTDKFYSRATTGKYRLDVNDLRRAFTLSEALHDKIKKFKEERISKIIANETPLSLGDSAKIILHLIPIVSFDTGQNINLKTISQEVGLLPQIASNGYNSKFNFDGFLTFSGNAAPFDSYTLLFKTGIIESVNGEYLNFHTQKEIPSVDYEQCIVYAFKKYREAYNALNIGFPIIASLTFVGVKGYTMGLDPMRWRVTRKIPIDRDILLLPDILIENFNSKPEIQIKEWFDGLWNACGFDGSKNYEDNGNWKLSV